MDVIVEIYFYIVGIALQTDQIKPRTVVKGRSILLSITEKDHIESPCTAHKFRPLQVQARSLVASK